MIYRVTVTVQRKNDYPPEGVTGIEVTRNVQAAAWDEAVDQATLEILADLRDVTRDSADSYEITAVQADVISRAVNALR